MNVEELSMLGPSIDLETVDSIHKKRLLAFVNHFVITTASFLNTVAKACEQRFMSLEDKIQKLEASITIIESKLSSVPGLKEEETVGPARRGAQEESQKAAEVSPAAVAAAAAAAGTEAEPEEEELPEVEESEPRNAELAPELMKYVKMLQFGVPAQAVRLKLKQDGIDPSLHEDVFAYK